MTWIPAFVETTVDDYHNLYTERIADQLGGVDL